MSKMNYALRKTRGELSGHLGWLFTMYYLHCDQLMRCYPSNDLLMIECGMSENTLIKHRQTLIDMKALFVVPTDKRISPKEKQLHHKKYLYQITGVIVLSNGDVLPTLYISTQEAFDTHCSIMEDLGFDIDLLIKVYNFLPAKNEAKEIIAKENEPEVVHIDISGTNDISKGAEPLPQEPVSEFITLRNKLDGYGLLLNMSNIENFKADYDDYSYSTWLSALELFAERRKAKSEYLPYKYLQALLKSEDAKAKQVEAITADDKAMEQSNHKAMTQQQAMSAELAQWEAQQNA